MKQVRNALVILIAVFFVKAVPLQNNYTIANDYHVTIHGTSNVHNWDETVSKVTGAGIVSWNPDGSFDLTSMTINMDVHSIKSDTGPGMGNNTCKALKGDKYPEIVFALSAPVKSVQAKGSETVFSAKGTLAVAGVTRPIAVQVKVFMQSPGKLVFQGAQTIKMTDYGIAPPTALFGAVKTGNEITISFKTSLQ